MMALISVIDRKIQSTILFFCIGVTIHFSFFLFLAPLLMLWYGVNPKILKTAHLVCFLVFSIVLAIPNDVIVFKGNLMGMEKYAEYGKGAIQGGANTFYLLDRIVIAILSGSY